MFFKNIQLILKMTNFMNLPFKNYDYNIEFYKFIINSITSSLNIIYLRSLR